MTAYVALLRGINVSGQKIILMADLKKLFESLKFTDVKTFIQSGNVVFQGGKGSDRELAEAIEKAIAKKYSFHVPVIIRKAQELAAVVEANPYRGAKLKEGERIYVSYLSEPPAKDAIKKLGTYGSEVDEFTVKGSEVYILCRGGYGNSVFSNTLMEKCLGVKSTTRNLETTTKLIALSAGGDGAAEAKAALKPKVKAAPKSKAKSKT
jgi:uncharacterized protein (DUF1697 family)